MSGLLPRRTIPGSRDLGLSGGCEAVAAHHFEERADVGRATRGGGQHVADLYEVVGPEDAGSGDGEELRVDRSGVGELMDVPATDADRVAGSDLAGEAVDGEGEDAFEA